MPTIAQFLTSRLKECGVKHIFGVPGDFILNLYNQFSKTLPVIGATDEECAGFAADAYARMNGIGCVCSTYCVGGFKLLNPIAGAFAEKSPVVVISGSPGKKERTCGMHIHHAVGEYDAQFKMFQHVTCASCVLDNPVTAAYEIDRVLLAMKQYKQPVYIEVPRDMVDVSINYDAFTIGSPKASVSDQTNLSEVLNEAVTWINSSKKPVILAGIELARFGMGEAITKFARKYNIPIATTVLSKSLTNESHPISLGVYCGEASNPEVKQAVEGSDCLIMLGVMITDVNFGFKPSVLKKDKTIFCTTEKMGLRNHYYESVLFQDFVSGLLQADIAVRPETYGIETKPRPTFTSTGSKVTVKRLFEKIDSVLDKNIAIIADVGDALFGSNSLTVHHSNHFLAQAFYTSMGFAVPAALGVQIAKPDVRPIVLVGDGAFQMTGMELSTIAYNKLNPIIVVLNNGGYTVERFLIDGPFNDIPDWQYHRIPEILGHGAGKKVVSECDLDLAFAEALGSKEFYVMNVVLDKKDRSATLERMTSKLQKIV
jgi:indolepyruvate decarboxylase